MAESLDDRYAFWHGRLREVAQDHVLAFWPSLTDSKRLELLADLDRVDVAQLPSLARLAVAPPAVHSHRDLAPAVVVPRASIGSEVGQRGTALLAAGKVAAFTVAGGQGTRLGFDGPKGALPISPVRNKPLFQLFAEAILATGERYGRRPRWYIMTSPANDSETRQFFSQNGHFGLAPDDIAYFQQGVMPAFDRQGKMLLDQTHRLALSPDGHGGSLLALRRCGALHDMAARGITHISYFQVDNPLVFCLDPVFIGLHDRSGADMSSKTLSKADDLEKVGNFVMADGVMAVIEYSDLPEALARARNFDGSRRFDAANIAVHLISREFVERLTADSAAFALPWHRAEKKVPFVDVPSGRRIEPATPNGIKLECFVFDALPLAARPVLLETTRAEEFSPVKNATGVDSLESARRDMSRRAARWLEAAGWKIPRRHDGEPGAVFEISPLLALDADELAARRPVQRSLLPGEPIYLE
jgi:UDP-N-acetylglucosamine/UDP-N-acetylgalactosamine diphosphorylase